MNYNVLVVGAGPSGVSAAYFIKYYDKENLFNVDLVEKLSFQKYERYHDMCGEAASRYIIDEIRPIKLRGITGKVSIIRESWPGNIVLETKMDGYLINRVDFLKYIIKEFEKKGGKFENRSVKNFVKKHNKIKIEFMDGTYKNYDYVVAADGANSLFRKKANLAGKIRPYVQYIIDKEPEEGILKFFYDEKYKGDYKWIFPHEGKIKLGYPLFLNKKLMPKKNIITKQSRFIGYGGIAKYVVDRILFVGDAACQANPLSKGGIRSGMFAGKLAAEAISKQNIELYEKKWLKTTFASNLFIKAFRKLENMDNKTLEHHIRPFENIDLESSFHKFYILFKISLFYRKYIDLYKAYELTNTFGW